MKINDAIVISKFENEGVLFDPEKTIFFAINEVAILILELIKSNSNLGVEDIVTLIAQEYNVNTEELHQDVCDFIDEAKKSGVINDEN